jgi:hypothetical protein
VIRREIGSLDRCDALFAVVLCLGVNAGCSNPSADSCAPSDQDGVIGGANVVLMNVSDTAFAVGGVDSGSTQPNITVQNSSTVTLTLTNVGSRPHDLLIQCIPSGAPAGCSTTSCFPSGANFPALAPGQSMTATFATPAVEGAYPFNSDEPGDSAAGLVGEFNLM